MIFRLVPRSHRSSVLPAYLSYSARNDCEAAPAAILTLVCVLSLCVCVCVWVSVCRCICGDYMCYRLWCRSDDSTVPAKLSKVSAFQAIIFGSSLSWMTLALAVDPLDFLRSCSHPNTPHILYS